MSQYFVYVCDLVQISDVNVLGFESRFSSGYCDQFYGTSSFFWESDLLSHGVSSFTCLYLLQYDAIW